MVPVDGALVAIGDHLILALLLVALALVAARARGE
jgi:hypothetical protein